MNANYPNQYYDSQAPAVSATSPYQTQNFTYQNKPAQYPAQARFMPSPAPINPSMPQIMPNYQRPTPTSTPATLPVQSPTSPSVSTFYPQYAQYPSQYQPVQYGQLMPNQMINPMAFQDQARFGHQIIQQPPIQHPIYPSQFQPKVALNSRPHLTAPSPAMPPQKSEHIITDSVSGPSANCAKSNVNKCQPAPLNAQTLKDEPDQKQEPLNRAIYFLINLPLSSQEEDLLCDYDSRLYGFLRLDSNQQIFKKYFLLKAINCFEQRARSLHLEWSKLEREGDGKKLRENRIKRAKVYLSLGHFYLLVYDYSKALQSYQKFVTFNVNKLKDSTFYYGLGIVYFVFGAFK
ncbi:histone demethylase UTY isoform X1 [Brachionus plicatilis]|uniref:Histone demethylase UTY isoform X1 n=1 Tax=Brachionus plicatilis TaxID=10195 RepID=A0A3M7RB99_BRAPC|nr:histone demethylase UTY isoform X1 [Brachionus plicatilis]